MEDTEQKKKDLARSKASKIQTYLDVFTNEKGREVLLDLMNQGFILKPTAADTAHESALNEGKREMMLYILDMVTYNVEDIMDILDTTKKRKETRHEDEKDEFDFFKD